MKKNRFDCDEQILLRMLLLLGCSSLETNSDLSKFSFTVFGPGADLILLLILLFLWGDLFNKCLGLRCFKSDQNEI